MSLKSIIQDRFDSEMKGYADSLGCPSFASVEYSRGRIDGIVAVMQSIDSMEKAGGYSEEDEMNMILAICNNFLDGRDRAFHGSGNNYREAGRYAAVADLVDDIAKKEAAA